MHELYILVVSDVLHCLAEYTIVHKFEKIFFKLAFGIFLSLRIKIDIWFEPANLGESDDAVYFRHSYVQLTYSRKFR